MNLFNFSWLFKKISLASILVFLSFFAFGADNVFAAGVVSLSGQPATINATVGNTVTMTVSINTNGDSVSAAELHFGYDATALQGLSISHGSLLPTVLTPGTNSNGAASITLGADPTSPVQGTGTIATLTFKALKAGSTTINLTNSLTASIGKTGNTAGQLSGTTVNIVGIATSSPAPTPVRTIAPTANPTPAPTAVHTPIPTIAPTPDPTQAPNIVSLNMSPATLATTAGNTISIKLNLDTSSDKVSATELHLNFDKTKLQAQSLTAGAFLPVVLGAGTVNNTAGTASIILGSNPTTPASGTGTLATITFKALAAGPTTVSYAGNTLTASIGKPGNSVSTLSGSDLTITQLPTPTPVPTSTPKPTPNPTPKTAKDRTPPSIKITSPSQGALVLRSTRNHSSVVQIKADASDNVGVKRALFFVNGIAKCVVSRAPFQCNWTVQQNNRQFIYTITAIAFDASGNLASDNITVIAR